MASKSDTTTDHDEIRRWVKEHDGKRFDENDLAFLHQEEKAGGQPSTSFQLVSH